VQKVVGDLAQPCLDLCFLHAALRSVFSRAALPCVAHVALIGGVRARVDRDQRQIRRMDRAPSLSAGLAAAYRRPIDLAGVASHLQAHKHFNITGVASGLGGGDATLAQGWRKLRPFLLELITSAFFISQTLPERRIQAQAVAHPGGRAAGGLDVETGDLVGDGEQQRAAERKYYTRGNHMGLLLARVARSELRPTEKRRQPTAGTVVGSAAIRIAC
jgi:hypothetical protein